MIHVFSFLFLFFSPLFFLGFFDFLILWFFDSLILISNIKYTRGKGKSLIINQDRGEMGTTWTVLVFTLFFFLFWVLIWIDLG